MRRDYVYRDIKATIEGDVPEGKGYSRWGSIRIHLKQQSHEPDECYELFNEAVAIELARISGLPVLDQFFFLQGSDLYSITPRISNEGSPPMTSFRLKKALSQNKRLTHGMILFDLWIANNDRRAANIQHARKSGEFYLIDFGNALLYRSHKKGLPRLEEMEQHPENLYNEKDKPYEYTDLLQEPDEVDLWCDRFSSIPEWIIENAVEKGDQVFQLAGTVVEPSPGALKSKVFDFLIKRKNILKALSEYLANIGIFANYKPQPEQDTNNTDTETKGEGEK